MVSNLISRLAGMLTQQRIIIILTAILIVVGIGAFLAGREDATTFDMVTTYEKARSSGELPQSAPVLPKCAQNIELKKEGAIVTSIAFDCPSAADLAAFVALIRSGFSWNIFVDKEHITLEAVTSQQ